LAHAAATEFVKSHVWIPNLGSSFLILERRGSEGVLGLIRRLLNPFSFGHVGPLVFSEIENLIGDLSYQCFKELYGAKKKTEFFYT